MACEYYKNCPGYGPDVKECANRDLPCRWYDQYLEMHESRSLRRDEGTSLEKIIAIKSKGRKKW